MLHYDVCSNYQLLGHFALEEKDSFEDLIEIRQFNKYERDTYHLITSVDIIQSSQYSSGNDACMSFEGRWRSIDIVVLFKYSSPSIEAAM